MIKLQYLTSDAFRLVKAKSSNKLVKTKKHVIFAYTKTDVMIKQDYLIRMIQEIITLIANALLNKQKIRKQNWVEYDCLTEQLLEMKTDQLVQMSPEEIMDRYKGDPNAFGKTELAAMTLLKIADEMEEDRVIEKSRLKQQGVQLLDYVQKHEGTFSLQRAALMGMLKDF